MKIEWQKWRYRLAWRVWYPVSYDVYRDVSYSDIGIVRHRIIYVCLKTGKHKVKNGNGRLDNEVLKMMQRAINYKYGLPRPSSAKQQLEKRWGVKP